MKEMNIQDLIYKKLQKAGLSSKSNMESLIAFIDRTKNLAYYEFPLINKEIYQNSALSKYDIPQYIKGIPEGYSVICTIEEATKIRNHEKKMEKKIQKSETEKKEIDKKTNFELDGDILIEPEPKKDHNYCHICRKKFDNYLKHIDTDFHKRNNNNHSEEFEKLKNSFIRINSFWKENKTKINENQNLNKNQSLINLNSSDYNEDNENKDKIELKMSSQLSNYAYIIKQGCQQKKKFTHFTTEQSTDTTSFNPIKGKKRKKNEFQKQYETRGSKSEIRKRKEGCRLPSAKHKK